MSTICFMCDENMFLKDHIQYYCINCTIITLYCLKCNKNLEVLLHCAFFKCTNCKRLTRTTKMQRVSANNNEILQHLFKNNTQDQQIFKHYFNFGEGNNLMPYNVNYIPNNQSNKSETTSGWINDKATNSKGNFIFMSKEKDLNLNNENNNPTILSSETTTVPLTILDRNKDKFSINYPENNENSVPNILNLTDDITKKCNLSLEKNDINNFSSILFNSSVDYKIAGNYNLLKPKSMLRQVVEETTSKLSKNYKALPKFKNTCYTSSPQKFSSSAKLDSSLFSAYNKSDSKLPKSPSVTNFKDLTIKKSGTKSIFSDNN